MQMVKEQTPPRTHNNRRSGSLIRQIPSSRGSSRGARRQTLLPNLPKWRCASGARFSHVYFLAGAGCIHTPGQVTIKGRWNVYNVIYINECIIGWGWLELERD